MNKFIVFYGWRLDKCSSEDFEMGHLYIYETLLKAHVMLRFPLCP